MLSEAENYLQRIDDLREQICALISGFPQEALNWRPIDAEGTGSTNSLAALAAHIAGAERFWMGEVVGGLSPTRDRDAEFAVVVSEASPLVQLLKDTGAQTREILGGLTQEDLGRTREARGRTIPVRWCLLHVVDHTALHLGHMQLTGQLWMGGQGAPSPRWFERLGTRD